jgi:cytochrome P450
MPMDNQIDEAGAGPVKPPREVADRPLPVAPGVPILGAAREMLTDAPGFVLRTARELGPIFRIPLGPRTITLIAHPQDVKQLMQDDHKEYPRGKIFDVMRPMLGVSLPTADGEVWRRKRRTMQPGFNKPRIAALTDAMSAITKRYADKLQNGQRLDCHELMTRVTRDIIVETMLSNQLGEQTTTLDAAFAELNRWVARYSFVPFSVPMWLPTPDNIAFKRARATFDRLIVGLIETRQKSGERHNDLLDALLEARDEDGVPMPPSELRDEVAGLYFAGHETSANTLTWAFAMLAQHPEVFARVREEADRVIGDRPPTAEDVAKLEYTGCVVRETLRLYPAGWVLGRTATRDASLRGYPVRKGDFLGISPFVTHRMAENWPDPDRFDPQRFAGDKSNGNRNFTYFPFGAGPHMCIGIHLALVEMQIVLAMFARRASLVVEHPDKVRMTSKLTLQVDGGLPVRVELRNAP